MTGVNFKYSGGGYLHKIPHRLEKFLLVLRDMFQWFRECGLSRDTLENLFPYFSTNNSQLYLLTKTPKQLDFAFDIEISGKSEALAKLANSAISTSELEIIAMNPSLIASFIDWLNQKQEDHPDEELGNIGEEFIYRQLCQIFGDDRVSWERKPEYDFLVLEPDKNTIKYYIDAKTTNRGIANSDNVPFFMRMSQWNFLKKLDAQMKYLIARVFNGQNGPEVIFIGLSTTDLIN